MKKLTMKQANAIDLIAKYPKDMVMDSGWMTGGHGIKIDLRTLNSLKRMGAVVQGKINPNFIAK